MTRRIPTHTELGWMTAATLAVAFATLMPAPLTTGTAHANPTDPMGESCADDGDMVCMPGNAASKPPGCYSYTGSLQFEWPCQRWDQVTDGYRSDDHRFVVYPPSQPDPATPPAQPAGPSGKAPHEGIRELERLGVERLVRGPHGRR